ncbi:hypothetical protein BC826DRAFT_1100890 [Russula brevipes]|nr:hypothetical protein BC826DRAFT_1100890 [Russula brevipes]
MVEPFLALANFLLPQSTSSSRSLFALQALMSRLLLHTPSRPDFSQAQTSKGKGKAVLGDDHSLFERSDWLHIAHHRPLLRISGGPFSHRHRIRSALSKSTILSPSARHGSSGAWRRKDVRYFGFHAHAIRYNDTGRTQQAPPSSIVDRFVNGEPLPNSSHLVDLKAAWSALVELRKQSCPPRTSVVLGFVDRALSIVEGSLTQGDELRELVRWSVRLRRALRQLGDIENLPPAESVHAFCLMARIQGLLGRFEDVTSYFPRIFGDRTNNKPHCFGYPELKMVETVLQALFRYRGPVAVLDFLVAQWHTLGRLVDVSPRRRSLPSEVSNIAFRIFDHIRSPVAVVANMRGKSGRGIAFTGSLLIRYLIQRRVPEDALSVYREMQRQSVDITLPLKLWLVRTLVRGHAVESANVLFSEISASIPSAHENSLFLATALHLFSSQGDTTRSEAAFKALEDRNMVDYRSIGLRLLAHARNGDVDTVLRYFHHHFPRNTEAGDRPDIFHYTAILMAHAKACDSAGLNEWLGNMIADGVKPDRHVYNILLEDCAQRGRFEDVASVIKDMRIRGLPPLAEAYTTIITALAKRGDTVTAEAFYKKALREGVKPDRQMIASLMTAHSEVGSWKGVIRVFDYLTSSDDHHLRPRIDIYNILLNAYVLAGSPFEIVSDVFQRMEQSGIRPTVHTFSILIKSACDSGKMAIAMRVFTELDSLAESWKTGFTMNVYALTILMAGYLRQGDQLKAKEIYDEMLFRGIAPTSSLLESPDQSQKWLSTYSRFSGFEDIYSPLMTLFARNAKAEQVEELMDDMAKAGGERTLATLTILLNAYRNAGDVDECRRVWDEIFPAALRFLQYGQLLGHSDPDATPRRDLQHRANIICVPLSIHMDALSAAGAHAEVAELWKTVRAHGFALDSHNWNHLIVVLVRAGEVERAFEILERIILPCLQRSPGTMADATTTTTTNSTTSSSSTTNVTAIREAAPRTPLSYDDDGPPPQDPSALAMEATRSRRTYLSDVAWASGVQLAKEHVGTGLATLELSPTDSSAGERPDFAHPLRVLQEILPSWNTWQPHAAVVILLMDVLGQLEVGHMIEPIPPRRFADAVGSTTWQGEESEASAARSLLGRIHASCPQAVTIVREYHYRIRVRRELARMVDEG